MIHVVRNNNATTFGNLEIGDLFFSADDWDDCSDYVFQKTIPVIDKEYPDDDEILNGVMVIGDETGNIIHFDNDDKVVPISNGILTVK